jgi:hypothetical protein
MGSKMAKKIKYILLSVFFLFLYMGLNAEGVDESYETIKESHKNEYKSGVYKDTKKDYVRGWINQDINYQKTVNKLISDYRNWAGGRIQRKEEVNYDEYISLKKYTDAEKSILLDYHNRHYKNTAKISEVKVFPENPVTGKIEEKKDVQAKITAKPAKKNKNKKIVKKVIPRKAPVVSVVRKDVDYITANNDIIQNFEILELSLIVIILCLYYRKKNTNIKKSLHR